VGITARAYGEDGTPDDDEPLLIEVPELAPGQVHEIRIDSEMPHDAIRVELELDPNPIDADPSNNTCETILGVPAPVDVVCGPMAQSNAEARCAASLTWTNPVPYDDVLIYRDGDLISVVAGGDGAFVDRFATQDEHEYSVRGRIRATKSAMTSTSYVNDCPTLEESVFRRGDGDASGVIDITDAIRVLGYLFLGAEPPPCPDAADTDDNGALEITDPIRVLGYLFLGSEPPPRPGPTTCGPDPTTDGLDACEYAPCQ
jgi:hypothetical protein